MRVQVLRLLLAASLVSFVDGASAQNVGINATGAAPAASAILDLASTNTGLLVPRIALTATNSPLPVTAPAVSLLVYNTATAGAAPNNVTPGYYYWDGTAWVRVLGNSNAWQTLGNTGTNVATNFLGTTDNVDFAVRTNNLERMRVQGASGRVGINTTAPTTFLEVSSPGISQDAIYGHSPNVGGTLGREVNFSFGVPAQTINGAGVYASNPTAAYTSAYAQSTGAATVAANISYSDVWMASYNYVQNGSAINNPSTNYNQLNVTNAALPGDQIALRGLQNRATTAGNPGFSIGTEGLVLSANQDAIGVQGYAFSNAPVRVGGYFEGIDYTGALTYGYAYVGGTLNGVTVNKIIGLGAMAEIVPTADHGRVKLTAPESPEYWYQDYGTVELVNGHAHVDLDPILADIIVVNEDSPIRVFCTPVDMLEYNGVAITNRTATGFDIVEVNGGVHSGTLDYQLIAKPKTNYGEGRFPQAPGPGWLKPEFEPAAAKASNQPQEREIFTWPPDWEVYGYDVEKATPLGGVVHAGPNAGKIKVAEGVFLDHLPAEMPQAKR